MNNIVEVKSIEKKYGRKIVIDNIDFDISEKEIVGFIGPNGAGKSTVMKCLCGLIRPSRGEIKICNYDIVKERENALSFVSALIENPGIYPEFTGEENLKLISVLKKCTKQELEDVKNLTNIKDMLNEKAKNYSLGMKQRLGLGMALLGNPKFLILDEPTNGLDPTGVIQLRDTLHSLKNDKGISILMSSHQLGEVEKVCDRILWINHGKLVNFDNDLKIQRTYCIKTNECEEVMKIMQKINNITNFKKISPIEINFTIKSEKTLSECITKIGDKILDISKQSTDVEILYKEMIGE